MCALLLLLLLFVSCGSACNSIDKVCWQHLPQPQDECTYLAGIAPTCPPSSVWSDKGAIDHPNGCYIGWDKKPDWRGTVQYQLAAVCNVFQCNCDLCTGCGNGRYWHGTPSCVGCNGCEQRCGNSNWLATNGGGCKAPCSAGRLLEDTQEDQAQSVVDAVAASSTDRCGDLEATLALPAEELLDRLSGVLCEKGNGTVGYACLGDFLDSIDVNKDGDISCGEYLMLKRTPPDNASFKEHKKHDDGRIISYGVLKVRKPNCKMSALGEYYHRMHNAYLKKHFVKPQKSRGK